MKFERRLLTYAAMRDIVRTLLNITWISRTAPDFQLPCIDMRFGTLAYPLIMPSQAWFELQVECVSLNACLSGCCCATSF
jgi:hypothetical protein